MIAEILAVGTELLMGQIANTNAQYISKRLNELGIGVYYHSVVGDNPGRLKNSLNLALSRADVIITTGGLGPTQDDLTKETIAEALGRKLVFHEETYQGIKAFFEKINKIMADSNGKQAYLPEGSIIVPNPNGTAPGCIIEKDNKIVVMLPGPPKEMIPMFEQTVCLYFESRTGQTINSRMLKVFGIGESEMELRILDIIEAQSNPTIAPYVGTGEVIIRVTAHEKDKERAEQLMEPVIRQIRERLGSFVYSDNGETMEEVVVGLLKKEGITLSVAESCTGGLVASTLISVPGVSEVFDRGFITYSNEAKIKELGVSEETIARFGAVSRETAEEMVSCLVKKTGTRAGIAVTGIAGPDGGTREKPVGLVCLAVSLDGEIVSHEVRIAGDRDRVRHVACLNALNLLRKKILGL
jgi:nicotinamide-nucleotide amidase